MFDIDYADFLNRIVAEWLNDSHPGDTILLLLAMRLSDRLDEGAFVEWSQWISNWRLEILAEIARASGGWDWGKESLVDKLSDILLTVTDKARFNADYLINLRADLEARPENIPGEA
ncbi:hypothetical protein [Rhodopseudomonas palustris]